MSLLHEAKPRRIQDVTKSLAGNSRTSIAYTLQRMTKAGLLQRDFVPQPRNRPAPVYSIWSES